MMGFLWLGHALPLAMKIRIPQLTLKKLLIWTAQSVAQTIMETTKNAQAFATTKESSLTCQS